MRRCLRRLCRYSDQVRAQRNMCQRQSFGHASYTPGLARFLDIFEPTKWRAFDAGNAQSGVGLQDGVARATGFGDTPGHRQGCGLSWPRSIASAQGLRARRGGGVSAYIRKQRFGRLAAGEPRILSLVQFRQIRQAIYRQLLSIALASRGEAFNISANFFPRIHNSLSIKWRHRLVGVQNTLNHVIHGKLQNKRTAIVAVHHFGFWSSMRPEVAVRCAG
jgi:hypothetical protein